MRWKNRAWVVAVVVLWVCQGELSVASEDCVIAPTAKEQCANLARSCGPVGNECNTACTLDATAGYNANTVAGNAVDGVRDSTDYNNIYMTNAMSDAHFQVDLGAEMTVTGVYLQGRVTDAPPASGSHTSERNINNQVYVTNKISTSQGDLDDATELCATFTSDHLILNVLNSPFLCDCEYLPMTCDTPRSGRYVIVHKSSGTHSLQITELEVYGAPPCSAAGGGDTDSSV